MIWIFRSLFKLAFDTLFVSLCVSEFIAMPLSLSVLFLNMSGLSALQQSAVSSRASQGTTKLLV